MISILKMIVLGIVQGATEFLPVSSSGHLTIAQEFLGIFENRILFDAFLHVGTLIAIFMVFGQDVLALLSSKRKWIPYLLAASVPAVAVGFSLQSYIARAFESVLAVGIFLVGNSGILALGARAQRRATRAADIEVGGALIVGVAQAFAILPGISRSGSTVSSALLRGWDRQLAVRFSFLLAIPVIIGATGFEAIKCHAALGSGDALAMACLGLLVSAGAGYVALRLFLKTVEKGKLWIFSGYCFILGAVVIIHELVT